MYLVVVGCLLYRNHLSHPLKQHASCCLPKDLLSVISDSGWWPLPIKRIKNINWSGAMTGNPRDHLVRDVYRASYSEDRDRWEASWEAMVSEYDLAILLN